MPRGRAETLYEEQTPMVSRSGPPAVLVAHPGAEMYGSDRMALESVAGLVEAGARVTVVLPQRGALADALAETGARVEVMATPVLRKEILRPAGFLRFVAHCLSSVPRIVSAIRRHGPDGVYVSTITIPLWVVLARLCGVRTTCHVHEAEGTAPRMVRWLLALPVLAAHRIVANSAFATEVLCSVHPGLRGRLVVIANGVAGPVRATPARDRVSEPVEVLFVGRLSPRKGPQVAVEAVRRLRDEGLPTRLTLLGSVFPGYEWFERQLQESVTAHGLQDNVDFAGFRPEVWSALGATDIAVVPSVLDEPFGNTAVEALLAGRPVVVSDTSGLREASAGFATGVRVTPDDPAALAAAIHRLVVEWDSVREAVDADAREAARRHSPQRYRRRVAATVLGASRAEVDTL